MVEWMKVLHVAFACLQCNLSVSNGATLIERWKPTVCGSWSFCKQLVYIYHIYSCIHFITLQWCLLLSIQYWNRLLLLKYAALDQLMQSVTCCWPLIFKPMFWWMKDLDWDSRAQFPWQPLLPTFILYLSCLSMWCKRSHIFAVGDDCQHSYKHC